MKKKIDWLNHGLEFFVVIIGILIAFQLNTCSETKKRDKILASHKEFLNVETRDNYASLQYAQKAVANSLGIIDSLLQALEQQEDVNKIYKLAMKLIGDSGYFYVRKDAYNTLTDSGDIRFLDFEEKKSIITLYGYYDWTEAVQSRAFTGFDDYFKLLQSRMNIYGNEIPDIEVFTSREFGNAVGYYRYLLSSKQRKYKDCAEVIEKFMNSN